MRNIEFSFLKSHFEKVILKRLRFQVKKYGNLIVQKYNFIERQIWDF